MKRTFQAWYAAGLLVLMAALLPFIAWNGPVQQANLAAYDYLLRLHPPAGSPTVQQIVLLGLDDATAERYSLPLRRNLLAAGLQRLTAAPPKVLAVELPFVEETTKEADQMLVRVLQQFPSVVLGVEQHSGEELEGSGWLGPMSALRLPNIFLGHTHLSADPDGAVRSVTLRQGDEQEGYWALAVETALLAQGEGADIAQHGDRLDIGAISVPARAANGYAMWIRPAGTFRTYSFKQLLDGLLDPQLLAGKIVILGVTAGGAPDLEIQASIIRTLLDADFLHSLEAGWEYAMLLLLAAVVIATAFWRQGRSLLWVVAAGVPGLPLAAWMALAAGWIVPLASLAVSFFTAAALSLLATFLVRSAKSAKSAV